MKRSPLLLLLSLALLAPAFAQQKAADKKKPAAAPAEAPAPAAPKGAIQDVTPDGAQKLIESRPDVVVVDVRTVEEYDMGHIAGAKNISVIDNDFAEKLKEVEGKPVLVHCAAGMRSMRAVQAMKATGKFPEIFHLTAGMNGWQQAGKPVVKSPPPPKK